MSNVRGLVGIDAGVLDKNFAFGDIGGRSLIGRQRSGSSSAIDAHVDVTSSGHLEFFNAGDGSDAGDDLFGNFARRFT